MSFEAAYPKIKEGDVIGWIIVYGVRGEFRAYVDRSEGYTKATTRAGDLHGRVVTAVASDDFTWQPARGDGLM